MYTFWLLGSYLKWPRFNNWTAIFIGKRAYRRWLNSWGLRHNAACVSSTGFLIASLRSVAMKPTKERRNVMSSNVALKFVAVALLHRINLFCLYLFQWKRKECRKVNRSDSQPGCYMYVHCGNTKWVEKKARKNIVTKRWNKMLKKEDRWKQLASAYSFLSANWAPGALNERCYDVVVFVSHGHSLMAHIRRSINGTWKHFSRSVLNLIHNFRIDYSLNRMIKMLANYIMLINWLQNKAWEHLLTLKDLNGTWSFALRVERDSDAWFHSHRVLFRLPCFSIA